MRRLICWCDCKPADRPQEHFNIALSGGSTPRALHRALVAPPYRERVDWESMQYFWGDERFVPPDDPESNYRMARETLLTEAPVTSDQVHRVPTERGDPARSRNCTRPTSGVT